MGVNRVHRDYRKYEDLTLEQKRQARQELARVNMCLIELHALFSKVDKQFTSLAKSSRQELQARRKVLRAQLNLVDMSFEEEWILANEEKGGEVKKGS